MLYLVNWGTHQFMCRAPKEFVDLDYAKACCAGDAAQMKIINGDSVLLDFTSDEEGGEWVEDGAGAEFKSSIVQIRAEIMAGDNRPLYLARLVCAQFEELDDDALEPAAPSGLKTLSATQRAFADFLRLDDDLLATARRSARLAEKRLKGLKSGCLNFPSRRETTSCFH